MADRLPKLLAGLAVLVGVGALLAGLSVFVEAWQTSRAWAGTGHAVQADLPAEQSPVWLDAAGTGGPLPPTPSPGRGRGGDDPQGAPVLPALAIASPEANPEPSPSFPRAGDDAGGADSRAAQRAGGRGLPQAPDPDAGSSPAPPTADAPGSAPAVSLAAPADVALVEADFRFLDPPEPGAHARLAVTLQNRADLPSGPISLALSQRWFQAFNVFGAVPPVLNDRPVGDTERRFTFPGLAANERQTVELHLLATADEVDAPEVRVLLSQSDDSSEPAEIGKSQPRTVAPRPRPGPARAVIVPKLGVRASVVPVAWEPPPFVIGQLQGSAAVSEGNTILIGHLGGPQGDVFARLGQLRPGDEVTATSRGLEYKFVVSEIAVRPYDDVSPTNATATPRLTLMTCTGQWSVARQDYSHRLWVVAEPPELAQETIRANAARAAEAAREAEAATAARVAHEAELATQTAAAQPAPTQPAPSQTAPNQASAAQPAVQPAVQPASATPPPASSALQAPPPPTLPAGAVTPNTTAVTSGAQRSPAVTVTVADDDRLAAEPLVPGIVIDAPVEGERVPQRLSVRGHRTAEADPRAPLWLLVRADLEGSRWYALSKPLEVRADGTWQADLELGGAAGIHHELRVGVVDADTNAALLRHATERPGQPLDALPEGFKTGARLVVERR